MNDINITRSARKKYIKKVSINNQKIEVFIDTGKDICLMRANQDIRVGSLKLKKKTIRFRDIGSGDNVTRGEFDATIITDKSDYRLCRFRYARTMKYEIGADFLDTV
jgi:hypothetical protein